MEIDFVVGKKRGYVTADDVKVVFYGERCLAVVVFVRGAKMGVVSVHAPSSDDEERMGRWWDEFVGIVARMKEYCKEVIVAGDYNQRFYDGDDGGGDGCGGGDDGRGDRHGRPRCGKFGEIWGRVREKTKLRILDL